LKIKPTDLDRREHRRLAHIVHEREYRDGEYICEHGKPGAEGTVEILRRGGDGREVSLAMRQPPASFEESAAAVGAEAVCWFSIRARPSRCWRLANQISTP
jgi:CRP-like cAMP-binding protein